MTAGVLDIHFFDSNATHNGLWIEFKSPEGKLTERQKEFIKRVTECNHAVYVVVQWEAAKDIILKYIESKE